MCVLGIPVMIELLSCSTLTHECSFKCPLPWKQAAGTQVWYTDNGLSLFSVILCHFLSLHPAALPIVYPIFSLAASSHPFFLLLDWIFIHSCQFPVAKVSPSFLVLRFSFSQTFLPLSQFIHVNLAAFLTHLSLSLITLSTCHVILFVSFPSSISVYLCFITFISFHLYPGLSVNVCTWIPVH